MKTYAEVDVLNALLNPTPASSLTELGDKQTALLRHLATIFNIEVPPTLQRLNIATPVSVTTIKSR